MTIDEAIKHYEEVVEKKEITAKSNLMEIDKIKTDGILRLYDANEYESCMKCASDHRQLAEWLRELKTHREIHDILLQTLVDFDLDICCEDLMDNEKEQKICEENCDNKTKSCWVRWAKMKASEVNADEDSD